MSRQRKAGSLLPTVALVMLMTLIQCLDAGVQTWLVWRHAVIAEGQIWRLITGSFVHAGWWHLALNLYAFLLLLAVAKPSDRRWMCMHLSWFAAIFIGLGLFWLDVRGGYLGFSGVLHAFAASVIWQATRGRGLWRVVGLGLVVLKLIVETRTVSAAAIWLGMPVAPDAHALGALAGMLLAWRDGVNLQKTGD